MSIKVFINNTIPIGHAFLSFKHKSNWYRVDYSLSGWFITDYKHANYKEVNFRYQEYMFEPSWDTLVIFQQIKLENEKNKKYDIKTNNCVTALHRLLYDSFPYERDGLSEILTGLKEYNKNAQQEFQLLEEFTKTVLQEKCV